MTHPAVTPIRQIDTHRLVSSKYEGDVLARIADDDAHLRSIFDLDSMTNDEDVSLPGIHRRELVFGVFTWTGSREPEIEIEKTATSNTA